MGECVEENSSLYGDGRQALVWDADRVSGDLVVACHIAWLNRNTTSLKP